MNTNPNDALLYRMQKLELESQNAASAASAIYGRNINVNPYHPQYQQVQQQDGSIYENVTDLDAMEYNKKFESNNAKAQPQLKPSQQAQIYSGMENNGIRYAHTPQPSDIEPSPIYENLQVVSGE